MISQRDHEKLIISFQDWISNTKYKDIIDLLYTIFHRIIWTSRSIIQNYVFDEVEELINKYGKICVCKFKENKSSSSSEIAKLISNRWSKSIVYMDISKDVKINLEEQVCEVVLLADDYVGTGETFKDAINKVRRLDCNIKIICIAPYVQKKTINHFDLFCQKNNTEFIYGFPVDSIYDYQELIDNSDLHKLEEMIDINYKFGFNATGGLIKLPDHAPNNDLALLWKNDNNWKPLFNRYKDRDKHIKSKKEYAYIAAIINKTSDIDLTFEEYFQIDYIFENIPNFSIVNFCECFGITFDEAFKKLQSLHEKGIIDINKFSLGINNEYTHLSFEMKKNNYRKEKKIRKYLPKN